MGYASLAGMELPGDSRARKSIEQVLAAAKRAADLTQQMLACSGRAQFVMEPVDLSALIENVALIESMISGKATLRLDLSPDLPRIEADTGQVRQVAMNLIANASDALGERSGEIMVSTGSTWAEAGELPQLHSGPVLPAGLYVYLEVRDTGCGMDRETLAKIFDPFFTTKFTGRGLGLAAVLGIVRGHRGSIRVNSQPGEGSTFRVFFPASEQWETLAAAHTERLLEWRAEGTVLVVDDDDSIRSLAKAVLERAGLTVLAAADGYEAIRTFRERAAEIRAVLLDLTMPGMDGAEVHRQIKQVSPEVRVILCSGYNEHDLAAKLDDRPISFLSKPYDAAELLARMRAIW
jgi:two-component system cell cycle sensor histidine kinase/response regulator CckA